MYKMASLLRLVMVSAVLFFASAQGAHAQARRYIVFSNDCGRPIELMVYNADSYHNWQPHGWYKYGPYESYSYVKSNGQRLTQLEDHTLYIYAETTDSDTPRYWQGDGPEVSYQGGIYRTMTANTFVNSDGDLAIRLTCP